MSESIQCWQCGTRMTLDELASNDGDCPRCEVEVHLAEYLDNALSKVAALEAELERSAQQPQSAEAVAYRYRHSEQEKWHYGESAQSWWECQKLYTTPQPSAGVVMPGRKDESKYRGTGLIAARQWNACLDEFDRLNGKEVGRG